MINKKSICFVEKAISKHPNERNNGGLWLACQLRDQGYSESEAEPAMIQYANSVEYSHFNALASLRQVMKRQKI